MDKLPKPKKLIEQKILSGLGGAKDVSFGAAPPERRAQGDYSKAGIPKVESDTFDDYTEREARWARTLTGL
jgi:hypothetical protein